MSPPEAMLVHTFPSSGATSARADVPFPTYVRWPSLGPTVATNNVTQLGAGPEPPKPRTCSCLLPCSVAWFTDFQRRIGLLRITDVTTAPDHFPSTAGRFRPRHRRIALSIEDLSFGTGGQATRGAFIMQHSSSPGSQRQIPGSSHAPLQHCVSAVHQWPGLRHGFAPPVAQRSRGAHQRAFQEVGAGRAPSKPPYQLIEPAIVHDHTPSGTVPVPSCRFAPVTRVSQPYTGSRYVPIGSNIFPARYREEFTNWQCPATDESSAAPGPGAALRRG